MCVVIMMIDVVNEGDRLMIVDRVIENIIPHENITYSRL